MDSFYRNNTADQDKKLHAEEVEIPGLGRVYRSNPHLATRIDVVDDTTTYIGRAPVGTPPATAAWQIKRLTKDANGSVVIEYADGNNAFDNAWTGRAGLAYS